jgi:dTDP-4-dehydrorhamnose 3,5-epimerase
MHYSIGDGQAKLVRCGRGRILDVVVDLRKASPTFGQWEAHELDDTSGRQLYVPVGFAHGFFVLSDVADVLYKVSNYYDPAVERGFKWDDPEVGIAWPTEVPAIFSERDAEAPLLSEIRDGLPF